MKRGNIAVFLACTIAAGCNSIDSNVCEKAAQHIGACLGASAESWGQTCDAQAADQAEEILASSCGELSLDSSKSDFWSGGNPLCGFMIPVTGLAVGDICCFDTNCEDELVCGKNSRCQEPQGQGAQCQRDGHCSSGLQCIADKCQPPSSENGPCVDHGDCAESLICNAQKICVPQAGADAPCSTSTECQYPLVCGPTQRCETRRSNGLACIANEHCEETCIGGQCQTRSEANGSCDISDALDCGMGLTCVQGVCKSGPGLGEACDRNVSFQCPREATCWQGNCEARHSSGQPCLDMFDCQDSLFCNADQDDIDGDGDVSEKFCGTL